MPRAMGGCGGSCGAHERKAHKPRQLLHGAALWAESPGRSRVAPGHAPRRPIRALRAMPPAGRSGPYAQSWPCSVSIASSVVAAV